ncbi:hypothetical protein [Saccharopolyspora sp. CA-218241]|uniref:hypothetical protein n=1 Tax=Saccharopolyspora sp. CA-218241 TaxID=3240027 RepID=UPI003D960EDC
MITEPGARPEAWLYEALSAARLRPYLAGADGDPDAAWALYQWNLDVCAAFYAPLHWCEVALRNAMHDALRAHYRTDHWWDAAPLDANGRAMVAKARSGQAERKGRPAAPDDVVARLTLGFWVSLVSRGHSYDREFWHKSLHAAFPHYSGKRRDLHRELNAIRGFRTVDCTTVR